MQVKLTTLEKGRKTISTFLCTRFYSNYSNLLNSDYLTFENIDYTKQEKRVFICQICSIEVINKL